MLGARSKCVPSMAKREHPEEPVRFFALRVVLLLLGVVILLLTVLSLFPTDRVGENDTVTAHPTAESLLFVNMVLFCVHLLIAAAAEGSNLASGVGADRGPAPVVTLVAAHLVVDVCCKLTCFVHCVAIASIGPLIIVSMCVVGSALMYPALNDLREAMRSHHARISGERNVTHLATEAITRGVAVLGLQAYMLTESLACFGGDGSVQHMRRECSYTMFNLFALAAISFAFMFEVVVIDTGMATRHELLRCDSKLPLLVRINAAVVGWICVQTFVLWASRHNVPLNRENAQGEMVGILRNWVLCGAPYFLMFFAWPTLMFRVRRLVAEREERRRREGEEASYATRMELGEGVVPNGPGGGERDRNTDARAKTQRTAEGTAMAMEAVAVGGILGGSLGG